MEIKLIAYIIIGILYFVFNVLKKAGEQKKAVKNEDAPKPVAPPAAGTFEEIMRELRKGQAEAEARQKKPARALAEAATGKTATRPSSPLTKKIPVREKRPAHFEEGKDNYESPFERELTEEEKTERGNIRLQNEGIYKIETAEEQTAREEKQARAYVFDAREAFIGSLILERKY